MRFFDKSTCYVKTLIIYLLISLTLLAPSAAYCADSSAGASIDEVSVTGRADLKVSFVVKDAFTKDIEEAIKSGIPTSFTFIMELNRINTVWLNENLGGREFKHTVKYDSLKEEYELSLDETGERGIRTKDFNEMKRLMVTGSSVPLTPEKPLISGQVYEVRIMAELRTIELPFLLDYMLFFVKLWDFKTDWYTYRFSP